jgi:hypothetical protein
MKKTLVLLKYRMIRCTVACIGSLIATVGCAQPQLEQRDLGDVDKLLGQRTAATTSEKRAAAEWIRDGDLSAKEKQWDIASKMYATAAMSYPTFRALKSYGEATSRSDRRRETRAASIAAQKNAFRSGAQTLRVAIRLAEKAPGEATQHDIESLQAQISCLETYATTDKAECELVTSVIKRYATQK